MKIVRIITIYNEKILAKCINYKTMQQEGCVRTTEGYIPLEEIEEFEIIAE